MLKPQFSPNKCITHLELTCFLAEQVSLPARQLMYGLLHRDPKNRLASCEGANEIKQHPFFNGINWALIRCKVRFFTHHYNYQSQVIYNSCNNQLYVDDEGYSYLKISEPFILQ